MSITTSIKKAAHKVEHAVTGEQSQTDLLDTLKEEHEDVAALLKKLVKDDNSAARASTLGKIKAALIPHLRAEEKVLYDAIIALKDNEAQQDGEEGYIEHALAAKTLNDLGKIENMMSPEFGAAAKVLKELVEHHVRKESQVWSDARKHFSADQRKAMNTRYLAEKKKIGRH